MYSILAGLMIAMGGYLYLIIGGIPGAFFFALGLMTIVHFGFNLFTGKAGLLATDEIGFDDLFGIWCGNFLGCLSGAVLTFFTPNGLVASERATAIIQNKVANGPLENFVLAIGCGMLMYIAVRGYKDTKNLVYVFVPVAAFILGGFNHCVADMYYLCLGGWEVTDFGILLPITLGNIVGTNILPAGIRYYQS